MVGLVTGSGSRTTDKFLAHLMEEIKPGGTEVVFAKVSEHWESVMDTEAMQGNVWC